LHFITVHKEQSSLQLLLLGQVDLKTDLVQSELDLERPFYLTATYMQSMLLALVWQPHPQRIYLAGFGGGRLPVVLHHHFSAAIVECSEIDANIVEVAQQFFGVRLDDRLQVAIQDARVYLAQQPAETCYDIIMIDVFLGNGYSPYSLATKEFYELCQAHLSPNGVVVLNVLETDAFYWSKLATIRHSFARVYLCPGQNGNTTILATNGQAIAKADAIAKAEWLDREYQFAFSLAERARELQPWDVWAASMVASTSLSMAQLEQAEVLSDTKPPSGYDDLLPSFATVFAKISSQEPCPCGSGKLFQDCHEVL
jgi:spermidine synthase